MGSARLLLTAACLHLYPVRGPDPTLADLHALLLALAASDPVAWGALTRSPLPVVQFAAMELEEGRGRGPQAAISLAIQSVMAKLHTFA